MLTNRTKKKIKRSLPPWLLNTIQSVRARRYKPDPQVARLLSCFAQSNEDMPSDRIAMRPGLEFSIHPESRDPFQWFCWKSPNMVHEFDRFILMRERSTRFLDVGANH